MDRQVRLKYASGKCKLAEARKNVVCIHAAYSVSKGMEWRVSSENVLSGQNFKRLIVKCLESSRRSE